MVSLTNWTWIKTFNKLICHTVTSTLWNLPLNCTLNYFQRSMRFAVSLHFWSTSGRAAKRLIGLQEQLHGRGRASRGKSTGTSAACAFVYNKCITRKCLTLKMKVVIFTFSNSSPSKFRSRWLSTAFAMVPFNGKYLTSYLIVIVIFAFYNIYLSK